MKGKVKAFEQHAGVEEKARRHIPLKVSFHQGCLALLCQSIRCKKSRQGISNVSRCCFASQRIENVLFPARINVLVQQMKEKWEIQYQSLIMYSWTVSFIWAATSNQFFIVSRLSLRLFITITLYHRLLGSFTSVVVVYKSSQSFFFSKITLFSRC